MHGDRRQSRRRARLLVGNAMLSAEIGSRQASKPHCPSSQSDGAHEEMTTKDMRWFGQLHSSPPRCAAGDSDRRCNKLTRGGRKEGSSSERMGYSPSFDKCRLALARRVATVRPTDRPIDRTDRWTVRRRRGGPSRNNKAHRTWLHHSISSSFGEWA